MAEWKIDSITAYYDTSPKVLGYADVYVNSDGIISARDVPGKRSILTNSLSIFPKVIRTGVSPPLRLSEFCNFDTHTKYMIYAQDDYPFAYTTTELNATECGYETPLPAPAVPYNPFGNPTYGLYATYSFCDIDGVEVTVNISRKNYSGTVKNLTVGGGKPVVLSYKDNEFLDPINTLEAKLSIIQHDNFEFRTFYTQDERMFQVEIIKGGQLKFKGYIIPDSSLESFDAPKNEIQIRCTDGLTSLKEVTYPIPLGGSTAKNQSFKDVLCYCLAPLNLNIELATICNLYATTNKTGLDDDPLAQNKVNPLGFVDDKGTILKSYDVISNIANTFRAVLVQVNGQWVFVRRQELVRGSARKRNYNYEGLFLYGEEYVANKLIGGAL